MPKALGQGESTVCQEAMWEIWELIHAPGRGGASCWDWGCGPQVLGFPSGQVGASQGKIPPRNTPLGPGHPSGGLIDAREGSSHITHVSRSYISRSPLLGCGPLWGHCWSSSLGKAFRARELSPQPHLRATGRFTKHLHTSTKVLPPNNPMRVSDESCSFYTTNWAR